LASGPKLYRGNYGSLSTDPLRCLEFIVYYVDGGEFEKLECKGVALGKEKKRGSVNFF